MRLIILTALLTLLAYGCLCAVWPAIRSGKLRAAFWGAAFVIFGLWLTVRWLDAPLAMPAGWLVSAWVGASLVSIAVGICLLIFRPVRFMALKWRAERAVASVSSTVDQGRRRFLGGGLALPGVAVSVGAGGAFGGATDFVVRQIDVPIQGLPPALDGFRIGQITDVHVGDFIRPDFLERAVAAMNDARVDLQVMTGDLIDDLALLEPTLAALEGCRAPHGMLAVLGNHEKFQGLEEVLAAYDRHRASGRVRLLVDESIVLYHRGAPLRVVGVDYPMRDRASRASRKQQRLMLMRSSADKAFAAAQRSETILCLSHHPEFFPFARDRGAVLTLAGHTHGGQVAFLGRSLLQTSEYMLGRYQSGGAQLYVSGGTGHWLPFRVGVPTEVTVLTLRCAPAHTAA
jgi:predicted MPP superfamily phosphohydrolase